MQGEKPDWDSAKRMLGDSGFLKSLEEYDKVRAWDVPKLDILVHLAQAGPGSSTVA